MSVPTTDRRTGGTKVKRALGVQAALEWAFRVEQAQLELPPPKDVTEEGFGFGLEYVLLQRAVLGCKVDGGQHKMGSYTHPDAEVIAATVAGMPDSLGGIRMAIQRGRTGARWADPGLDAGRRPALRADGNQEQPAWRAGNNHRRRHRAGENARQVANGRVLACPVTWRPHPEQIASARRGYEDWWQALDWVRDGLIAGGMLREVEVTAAMPN
jgi:hypothetical protein